MEANVVGTEGGKVKKAEYKTRRSKEDRTFWSIARSLVCQFFSLCSMKKTIFGELNVKC